MRSIQRTYLPFFLEKTKSYRCYPSSNIKHSVYYLWCNLDTNCAVTRVCLFTVFPRRILYQVIKTETKFVIYDLDLKVCFNN